MHRRIVHFFRRLQMKRYVEITREHVIKWGKAIATALLVVGVIFCVIYALLYILISYLTIFPSTITPNLAMELLKAILQVNGFLIGFAGIIFAQLLRGLYSQQAALEQLRLKSAPEIVSPGSGSKYVSMIADIKYKRQFLAVSAVLNVFCFVASIFSSLARIAWTWQEGPPHAVTFFLSEPLLFLTIGIMLLFFIIVYVELRPV